MKKFASFMIVILLIAPLFFGQEKNTKTGKIDTLQNANRVDDEGHFFGIRIGVQVYTYKQIEKWKLNNWWTFFLLYEYRFDNTYSFISEYHVFREKKRDIERVRSLIETGIKFRLKIFKIIFPSIEGGIGLGGAVRGFGFFYGGGCDWEIDKYLLLNINARTFSIPDYGYWISVGLKQGI